MVSNFKAQWTPPIFRGFPDFKDTHGNHLFSGGHTHFKAPIFGGSPDGLTAPVSRPGKEKAKNVFEPTERKKNNIFWRRLGESLLAALLTCGQPGEDLLQALLQAFALLGKSQPFYVWALKGNHDNLFL